MHARFALPVLAALLGFLPVQAGAQQTNTPAGPAAPAVEEAAAPAAQDAQVDELRRRIEVLAAEVEKLRSGEEPQNLAPLSEERRRALGLAPSAASAYRRTPGGLSFAGYGEMLLENFGSENESGAGGAPTTRFDFLRAVLYTGYRFSDKFLFNSEIEVEHGNEIFIEFAYIDWLASEYLTLRGGMLLLPLGLTNEFHEPNVFLGAKRPETESRIIPSTWRENGAGVLGSVGIVNYRAYFTNGLNGAGFNASGLRGGRQKGVQARAAHMAFSGRLDVTPVPGIFGGVGFYNGGSGQEQVALSGERLDLGTQVVEVHGQAQLRGFDVRALYASANLEDAGAASTALRLASTAPIAERMRGGYVQIGYNVLSRSNTEIALTPYFRHENVDTQDRIPAGFTRDLTRDGTFRTLGVDVKPIQNVVLKIEHQWISNAANTGRNQFNVNLGYAF